MAATLSAIADLRERVSVREFERRLTRLSRKHQQLVREYLGTPADPGNVPESIWQEIERQHRAALMILLFGAAIPTLEVAFRRLQRTRNETLDQDDIRDELERLSRRRADWVSESVTNTTRDRLDRGFENGRDLDEVMQEIFGDDRWTNIARNESVAAQSAGGSSVAEAARNVGIPATEIWYLGKCDHCDTCPMLHGTSREFWGLWTQGPPLHPHCCCHIQVFFDEQDDLIRRRLLVSHNPSFAIVDARMQKFGRARGGGSTTITRSLGEFFGFTKGVEPKDGDGDGLIFDGTEQEQPVPEKRPNEASPVEDWRKPKPGTKLSIPAVGSRMPFTAVITGETDEDGNVIVSSEFGSARIPKESLQHFAADMTGDMRFLSQHGETGDKAVDDVIAGKGKMIGKGNDAVAFEIGDEIVKISSTVPYHPVGGPTHRTIMEMKVAAISAKNTFEKLKAAGVPGLPDTRFVHVGDKVISVQPKLTVGGSLNEKQLQQLRDSVQAIHQQGYVINDQLQFGVGEDGNLYHFDVSSARKSTDNLKKYDEERDVKYVFDQNGGKFHQSVESALENYQQARDSIEMRVASGRSIPGWAKRKISEAYEALEDAQHEIAWDVRDFMGEHGIPTAWEQSNVKN